MPDLSMREHSFLDFKKDRQSRSAPLAFFLRQTQGVICVSHMNKFSRWWANEGVEGALQIVVGLVWAVFLAYVVIHFIVNSGR